MPRPHRTSPAGRATGRAVAAAAASLLALTLLGGGLGTTALAPF